SNLHAAKSSHKELIAILGGVEVAAAGIEAIDLWVGGLAEDPLAGALVGELFFRIMKEQFEALRDGDRFWYARILRRRESRELEGTRLSNIIRRNTEIGDEIPDDVFHVPSSNDGP
ncbi:MAG: peroxidase family protein, partial [Alphaproteobacteria bacterium]